MVTGYGLLLGALGASSAMGIGSFLITFANASLLASYTALKRHSGLLGNLVVVWLCSSTLIVGPVMASSPAALWPSVVVLAGVTFSRELVFDIEDQPGDFLAGFRTLPVMLSPKASFGLAWAALILVAGFALAFELVVCSRHPGVFGFLSTVAVALMMWSLWRYQSTRTAADYRLFGVTMSHLAFFCIGPAVLASSPHTCSESSSKSIASTFLPDMNAVSVLLVVIGAVAATLALVFNKYNR
jgi:4-hydroxybenzoate polyprenyltransferase